MAGARIPYDTTISTPRTTEVLNYEPLGTRELLERFKLEMETGDLISPTGG